MIRKKIGLCLGGGSSLGFAHVGVIKALIENNIPFDIITGTSMGAVVGGAYALFQDINVVEEKALDFNRGQIMDFRLFPLSSNALFAGKKADAFYKDAYGEDTKIEGLKMPFGAVAVDIASGQLEYMTSGKLWEAVRASTAVPGVFSPYEIGDKRLVDGGIVENVPVDIAKKMGAEFIIAVDVINYAAVKIKSDKMIGILLNSFQVAQVALSQMKVEKADIVIRPDLSGHSMIDFKKENTQKVIEKGYLKTIEMIPQIKKLLGLKD